MPNMGAETILNERRILSESTFVEMVVWRVPQPRRYTHSLKYRLPLVVNAVCALRYDNESGKGDHRHTGDEEVEYTFTTRKPFLMISGKDVDNWSSDMNVVTLEVGSRDKSSRRFLSAMKGEAQGAFISFGVARRSFQGIFGKRWDLLKVMAGAGR